MDTAIEPAWMYLRRVLEAFVSQLMNSLVITHNPR